MSDLREGAEFALEADLTEQMVADFIRLSGDNAPLHADASFARARGFDGKLVHGALLVALVSRFVGMHFPGPRGLWLRADVRFPSPCYAPDRLTIRGRIVQVSEAASSIVIDISIVNRQQKQVLHAKSFHQIG